MEFLFKDSRRLFTCLLIFRIFNALLIQTSYVADEYWQSIEVAHNWVFGYGSLTWEWQSDIALRSPLHPILISLLYKLFALYGIDSHWLIVKSPQILHACFAAIADFHLYKFVSQLSGYEVARWTLFHHICNWFTIYCAPRSLSNCLEWCLFIIGLSYYPWSSVCETSTVSTQSIRSDHPKTFIFIAVLCVLLRPTAAIIWFPLCIWHLWQKCKVSSCSWSGNNDSCIKEHKDNSRCKQLLSNFMRQIRVYLSIIIPCVVCSCILDRWAFGKWTINQWNFVKFNVLHGGSGVYGVQPWHWYLSQGLVVMLLTQTPLVLGFIIIYIKYGPFSRKDFEEYSEKIGYSSVSRRRLFRDPTGICIIVILWTVMCYSFLSHKEFRFIFPLIPLGMYFCGVTSVWFIHRYKSRLQSLRSQYSRRRYLICFILVTQIPLALYTCQVHQRGGLQAVSFLNEEISRKQLGRSNELTTVLCLMPCHTVPSIGYLHKNITFRQLSCEPDLRKFKPDNNNYQYTDEADVFYENPKLWLENYYYYYSAPSISSSSSSKLNRDFQRPQFLLMFDHLIHTYESVQALLLSWNYKLCGRLFFSHVLTHSRYSRSILFYCLNNT
ncbi:unnamed protein product [Trichobilharzia szidati]|nr:unnamed protein product [Trichobilharzia szidati]